MASDGAFIFQMCTLRGKTFLWYRGQYVNVKIKYQGHIISRRCRSIRVSQTHLVYCLPSILRAQGPICLIIMSFIGKDGFHADMTFLVSWITAIHSIPLLDMGSCVPQW